MNYMEFYDVDVKSTVNINGKDVAFDYHNTYIDYNDAFRFAESLKKNNDVLDVSIHRWVIKEDGMEYHAEDDYINGVVRSSIPYTYTNKNHREWRD